MHMAYAFAICTGRFWEALGSSGKLWGALGGSGGYAINFHCENLMFFAKVPLKCKFYGVFLTLRFILTVKNHMKMLPGMLPGSATVSPETSRALYQHRQSPYS